MFYCVAELRFLGHNPALQDRLTRPKSRGPEQDGFLLPRLKDNGKVQRFDEVPELPHQFCKFANLCRCVVVADLADGTIGSA